MGILGSFNIGVTGLNAIGGSMSVVADNIANSSTAGFKASRSEFQDVLATSLKGIDGGDQIGAGTRLAHVKPIFTQGSMVRTEQVTDLAINGNGFFVIDAPFGRGYSRDGSFHFDQQGHLVTSDENKVLGFSSDEYGKIGNKVEPIKLGSTTIPAKATENVRVQMNFDSRENIKQFSAENPNKTSNYNTGLVVYDNVGTPRMITIYFNKVAENNWEYHMMVKPEDAAGADPESRLEVEMANGRLEFSDKGILLNEVPGENSFNFNKGARPGQKINLDFGKSITEGGNGMDATTQYGSKTSVARHFQDGSTAATLGSLSFNDHGILTAVYNNGEIRDIAQIGIAKFENNEGLFKVGKNLFKDTRKSGQPAIGKPSEHGRGAVLSKSIEESNVDIAHEFVSLMKAQRNFTANTRTITTADEMLREVLSIKR